MRLIVTLLSALLLFPTTVLGKSLYVKDSTKEVLVRTGPSTNHKILAILKPGQEVSLVREEGGYSVVTTPNGIQGYVLKYLMTDQNPEEPRLREEAEQRTQQRIAELEVRTQEQEKELTALREERDRLKDAQTQAEARAAQQAELVSQLHMQQSTAQGQEARRWFLTGAGVLLAGFLLGWMWGATSRRQRRSSLSLNRL
jgi:SH3 domain protein